MDAVEFIYDNGAWQPVPHNEIRDTQKADGALTVHPDYIEVFADHANRLYIFPIIECIRDRAYDFFGPAQPDSKHHPTSNGLILKQTDREGEYERVGVYHAPHLLGKSAMRAGHPKRLVSII
ncbi:hypothetical protein SLS55_010188 [Diplodia seriata]|uniref:Uncharacterized protein n=1 Tax=Diplodia seriata TaxID=420778 RepID=A0ABR3BYL8_9PEZI